MVTQELVRQELAKRGWIRRATDGPRLTDKGRQLRQEAEEATKRFFYGPWSFPEEIAQRRLRRLLIQIMLSLEAVDSV